MNKLNKLGVELINYKEELNKDYSDLIIRSLNQTINIMAENEIIDIDIHYALTHEEVDIEGLNNLLLEKKTCIKTQEELLAEYDEIRSIFNEHLGIEDDEKSDIKTISNIQDDNIIVAKNFTYNSEFAKNYFGIPNKQSLKTFMARQGVFEKFSILRLGKIIKDFIEENPTSKDNFEITFSDVFYENINECYGVSLIFKIDINVIELEENMDEIAKDIQDLINKAVEYFNDKMKV